MMYAATSKEELAEYTSSAEKNLGSKVDDWATRIRFSMKHVREDELHSKGRVEPTLVAQGFLSYSKKILRLLQELTSECF